MEKKLDIIPSSLDGVYIIKSNIFSDERGSFFRVFCPDELKEIFKGEIRQINQSINDHKGTLRGMHFQYHPNAEIKIVRCLKGAIQDVVVDIRKDSSAFLEHYSIELNSENNLALLIPQGFAHGFQTLEDNTEVLYMHSEYYINNNEGALNYSDPKLNINWKLPVSMISEKDKCHAFIEKDFRGI